MAMANANKRIPVTKDRWEELNELKRAGETYDELIDDMVEAYRKQNLAEMVREKQEEGEFKEVDPDEW